jgi:hypothetical protein
MFEGGEDEAKLDATDAEHSGADKIQLTRGGCWLIHRQEFKYKFSFFI